MTIIDVVQNADSEYMVYFLLAAYIEVARLSASLPEYVTGLPITGLKDVQTRFRRLAMELARPPVQRYDASRVEIREALQLFDAALSRLTFLERGKDRPPPLPETA